MQSKVHPRYKTKYRVVNWAAYNRALVRRGDVTVWMSSEAIAAWTPGRCPATSAATLPRVLRSRAGPAGCGLRASLGAQAGGVRPGQESEVVLGCEILNRMTALGRPVSYRIGR